LAPRAWEARGAGSEEEIDDDEDDEDDEDENEWRRGPGGRGDAWGCAGA